MNFYIYLSYQCIRLGITHYISFQILVQTSVTYFHHFSYQNVEFLASQDAGRSWASPQSSKADIPAPNITLPLVVTQNPFFHVFFHVFGGSERGVGKSGPQNTRNMIKKWQPFLFHFQMPKLLKKTKKFLVTRKSSEFTIPATLYAKSCTKRKKLGQNACGRYSWEIYKKGGRFVMNV